MAQYTLVLSFDLRQVTQSLAYKFILGNSDYPITTEGSLAGTFNFQENDEIFVKVVATSAASLDQPNVKPKDILSDFAVTNCTFVSIPAHMTEQLSLFDTNSACSAIDTPSAWGPVTREEIGNNTVQLSRRSLQPLTVETKNGQWKMSGYLSVELTPDQSETFPQLYFFDPESSSGLGGGFGP